MLRNWIVEIRDLIGAQADAQGSDSRDYACTLVFAIASDTQTILGQIGDGAVIVKNEESLIVPIWPENGEYANQTFFVTQEDSHHRLKLAKLGAVTDFIVISDGLQRLALREADRAPHSGFISPLIDAVRTNYDAAPLSVTQFLASPRVNERTDDDKAIVIACRIA